MVRDWRHVWGQDFRAGCVIPSELDRGRAVAYRGGAAMPKPANVLDLFHPVIRAWFAERVGEPTEIQALAWPRIAAGEHALLVAPTGSGKTLAAFLWALDRLLTGAWSPGARAGALRVAAQGAGQRRAAQPPGAARGDPGALRRGRASRSPTIRVLVRTGDTPAEERARMARRPPEILITTPESLNILLTSRGGRAMLGGVAIGDPRRGARGGRRQARRAPDHRGRAARAPGRRGAAGRAVGHRRAARDRRRLGRRLGAVAARTAGGGARSRSSARARRSATTCRCATSPPAARPTTSRRRRRAVGAARRRAAPAAARQPLDAGVRQLPAHGREGHPARQRGRAGADHGRPPRLALPRDAHRRRGAPQGRPAPRHRGDQLARARHRHRRPRRGRAGPDAADDGGGGAARRAGRAPGRGDLAGPLPAAGAARPARRRGGRPRRPRRGDRDRSARSPAPSTCSPRSSCR